MKAKYFYLLVLSLLPASIVSGQAVDDGRISVQFLQLNDVYEIAALEQGAVGGMARVAAVRQKLLGENPNTCTIMSGDFLFPSAMGTISYEGKAIKGRQMVEVMNAAGIDLVAFGNHEFDLKEAELQDRINESRFDWVSTNIRHRTRAGNQPFAKAGHFSEEAIPEIRILQFRDADGTVLRIGVFGICINSTAAPYVSYEDYAIATRRAIAALAERTDFIIAITHLSIDDDKKLAAAFPQLKLLIGGHEHIASYDSVGKVIIAKADANARTVYVHRLEYDKSSRQLGIRSELAKIDKTIPEEPVTKAAVDKWIAIANQSLRAQGFDPEEVLTTLSEPYDGHESSVRYKSTNLTRMIAKAFSAAQPTSDVSMYNSGSIRLDDELSGTITQYDVIRTLPYGGKIVLAEMKGSLLRKALDTAMKHPGNGCFLQYDRITRDKKGSWLMNGARLDDRKIYRVAVNDYLVSGMQQYLEFLNDKNPELLRISQPEAGNKAQEDLRQAVIAWLRGGGR
jgi:2',3'-cyclic-nucleotide 2'-phosphodiesterase (5'-nucleotidase family)